MGLHIAMQWPSRRGRIQIRRQFYDSSYLYLLQKGPSNDTLPWDAFVHHCDAPAFVWHSCLHLSIHFEHICAFFWYFKALYTSNWPFQWLVSDVPVFFTMWTLRRVFMFPSVKNTGERTAMYRLVFRIRRFHYRFPCGGKGAAVKKTGATDVVDLLLDFEKED